MAGRRSAMGSLGVAVAFLTLAFAVPATSEASGGNEASWDTPRLLNPLDLLAPSRPQVAVDATGNVTVVWGQSWEGFGPAGSIFLSRYGPSTGSRGSGWRSPEEIGAADGEPAPHVARNPAGDVIFSSAEGREYDTIAVWQHDNSIYATLNAPSRRSLPQFIGQTGNEGARPQVAMDAGGNAVVVWQAKLPFIGGVHPNSVYAAHFTPSMGWREAIHLAAPGDPRGAHDPGFAMNANGDGMAVWVQPERSLAEGDRIEAKRFTPGTGWSEAFTVDAFLFSSWASPRVALDDEGNALVVWMKQLRGGVFSDEAWRVFARHIAPSGESGPVHEIAKLIENRRAPGIDLEVAMGPNGNASVVWAYSGIHASSFTPLTGWEAPLAINGSAPGGNPQIAFDSSGNATLVWSNADGVYANQFSPGAAWGPSERVGPRSGRFAMDSNGNATVVVWADGERVFVNRSVGSEGWGPETRIEGATSSVISCCPQVAVDREGNAIAYWQQSWPTILARRFEPGQGWTDLLFLGFGHGPRLTLSPEGEALAVWHHGNQLLARTWTETGGLQPSESLGEGRLSRDGQPLVMGSRGDALVAYWRHAAGQAWRLHARHLEPSEGWGPVQILDEGLPPTEFSSDIRVDLGIDDSGEALAVWNRVADRTDNISANRFVPGQGWEQAEIIGVDVDQDSQGPRFAMDAVGRATVLWGRETPSGEWGLYARHFIPGFGWMPEEYLSPGERGPFEIGMNVAGESLAIWGRWGEPGFARWYAPETGWRSVERIPARVGEVEIDSGGNALIVTNGGDAWHLARGRGWQRNPLHSVLEISRYAVPEIAMDGMGNAIAVLDGEGIHAIRFIRTTQPDLRLTSPTETLTNYDIVTIAGVTSPGASVSVNGTDVPVEADGTFGLGVRLPDGDHVFEVIAAGPEGWSTETATVTVDTRPPFLILTSPTDGETLGSTSVTVAGRTEPGSRVVVDGIIANVAPDGTFAFRLALAEGRSSITVIAVDPAGNTASVSVTVDAVTPSPLSIFQAAILALSAFLLVGFLLLYRSLRGGGGGRDGRGLQRRLGLNFPLGRGEGSSRVRKPPSRLPSESDDNQHWPQATLEGSPLHLTAKERVVLHLLEYGKYADAVEVPPAVTQAGIAEAAGFDRRHFSQYVRPLLQQGLVESRNAHVEGVLQRRTVYGLSYAGWHKGRGIRNRIHAAVISVEDNSGVREASIAETLAEVRDSRTILALIREALETGYVDLRE